MTELSEHWEQSSRVIAEYLKQALEKKYLPESVVLVQFVAVPPQDETVDLKNHVFIRKAALNHTDLLRYYSYTVSYILKENDFFHRKATWDLHCPAGSMLVLTGNETRQNPFNFPEVNLFWFNYSFAKKTYLPFLKRLVIPIPKQSSDDAFPDFSIPGILACGQNQSIFDEQTALQSDQLFFPVEKQLSPAEVLSVDETKRVNTFFERLAANTKYLNHIIPCVLHGPVVLAAPRKLHFSSATNTREVGDSGLTIVFKKDHKLSSEDLERCYLVAHKLSSLFTSAYGIAKHLFQHKLPQEKLDVAMKMVETFRHEFNNTYSIVQSRLGKAVRDNIVAKPIFDDINGRLGLMSVAIDGLDSSFNLEEREPLLDQVKSLQDWTSKWLDFEFSVKNTIPKQTGKSVLVSKAFRLILSELTRNAYKYNPESLPESEPRRASLVISANPTNVQIVFENLTEENRFRSLQAVLKTRSPRDKNAPSQLGTQFAIGVQLCVDFIDTMKGQIHCDYASGKLSVTVTIPQ